MTDEKELERWAQDFLDFWQDQVTALSSDPALLAVWAAPLGVAGADQADWLRQWSGAIGLALRAAETGAPDAPGPTPPAAPPGERDGDLERVAGRLDALEKRLAALEFRPQGAGRGASPSGGGRKPRKSDKGAG